MNSVLCLVTAYMMNALWQVVLIAGAGGLVARLLQRVGPRAQHIAWVTTLVLAILTPARPVFRTLAGLVSSHLAAATLPSGAGARISELTAHASGRLLMPPSALHALALTYLLALQFFAWRFGRLLRYTCQLRKNARPLLLDASSLVLEQRCAHEFSVQDALILQSREVAGPMTLGLLRPTLMVPEGFFRDCPEPDQLAALAHEYAHMRRHDFLKNLLYEVLSLPIAFHPATWVIKSHLAQTREMVCDAMATRKVIDTHAYTGSLLRLVTRIAAASQVSPSGAIGIFDANILEKRIMIMKTRKPSLSSLSALGLIVPGTVLLFAVAAGGATVSKTIDIQSSPSASVESGANPNVDLACTFYNEQGRGLDGTCSRKPESHTSYICTATDDPTMSQEQAGCEWKVQRGEQLLVHGPSPSF